MPEVGSRIHSERLKGLDGPECTIPKCPAPGRMVCTGWLVFGTELEDEGEWFLESACPLHGPGLSSGGPSWPVVEEVLAELGLQG